MVLIAILGSHIPNQHLNGRQDNNRSDRSSRRKGSRPQTNSPLVRPQPLVNEDENSDTEVMEQPVEENYSEEAPQSDEDYEMNVEEAGDVVPIRRTKRLASPHDKDEFDDAFVTQRRDKRARNISREYPPIPETNLTVDTGADAAGETHTGARGRKRDRGYAASTFGGDEDLVVDDFDDKHKRNKRRRTVSTRKPRGQKRSRELHVFECGSDSEVERKGSCDAGRFLLRAALFYRSSLQRPSG